MTSALFYDQAYIDGLTETSNFMARFGNRITRKIRGGNITVKPGATGNPWAKLFVDWDWINWIKPQVDRAIAAGLETIRVIGSPEAVLVAQSNGQLTQAEYDAHWSQLAEYCLANGLSLYPCLVGAQDAVDIGGGYQDAALFASIVATVLNLAPFGNVIAFDNYQEGNGPAAADVLALFAAIRAVVPWIPLTMSSSAALTDTSSVPYQVETAVNGVDFVDRHLYFDGLLPSDVDFIINKTGKPILIGEFGDSQDQSQSNQTARFAAVAAIHNRPGVLGSIVWALADQDTVNTNQWGIWDNTGFAGNFPAASTAPLSTTSGRRTWLTNALAQLFNRADVPPVYKSPNLVPPRAARPVASVADWGGDGNTTIAASPRGMSYTAIANGSMLAGLNVGLAPVTPLGWYLVRATCLSGNAAVSRAVALAVDFWKVDQSFDTFVDGPQVTEVSANDSSDVLHAVPTDVRAIVQAPADAYFISPVGRVASALAGEVHYWNNFRVEPYVDALG